jgi:uncharacterized protein with HEPN domain
MQEYGAQWTDESGDVLTKWFARKTDRTKWLKKQDVQTDYQTVERPKDADWDAKEREAEALDAITAVQQFTQGQDTGDFEVEQVTSVQDYADQLAAEREAEEQEAQRQEDKLQSEIKQAYGFEPLPAGDPKRTKVRLTFTAEVDVEAFKARFGYTDADLRNWQLHQKVRQGVLETLEIFGRANDDVLTFSEAKQ